MAVTLESGAALDGIDGRPYQVAALRDGVALPAMGFIERFCQRYPRQIFETLLADRTTGGNIIWATDGYEELGDGYGFSDPIEYDLVTGPNSGVVKPRLAKTTALQTSRTRVRAEVFTPSWLVESMNGHLDREWFGRDVFSVASGRSWMPLREPVVFPRRRGRGWQAYVRSPRLEIACGEAPFICSRYDTVTGELLPCGARVGFLDRKLRVVGENVGTQAAWHRWALEAVKASFGYEYQGDNLLIARINVVESYVEHFSARWGASPDERDVARAAEAVSWNLWQMDGMTGGIPGAEPAGEGQMTLFPAGDIGVSDDPFQEALFELESDYPEESLSETSLKIYDWAHDRAVTFASLLDRASGDGDMKKFYAIVGNPPYQEEVSGSSDKPIYNYFMDEAYRLSDKVELVTPGRFLFKAGKTPKEWNEKMLSDEHIKVLDYVQDSNEVFPGRDIKGGVAVTYRDAGRRFGEIGIFSPFPELRSIRERVLPSLKHGNLSEIMFPQNRFDLDALYNDFPQAKKMISSGGRERRIVTSSFNKLDCFHDTKESDDDIQVFGLRTGNKRAYRWINRKYVEDNGNLCCYKVLFPKANGSGALGEIISTPLIGEPLIGYTQSFMAIGAVEDRGEAEAMLKYIKSKFARVLLGILKITQDNPPEKWVNVPLQDFSPSSDIDWSQSVADIDRQLYAKYGLSDDEVDFVESHVKGME